MGLSTHWPDSSLRRLFTAMRRLQTGVPPGVWRSSGSRVRLPTSTTRLMFAIGLLLLLVRNDGRLGIFGRGVFGCGDCDCGRFELRLRLGLRLGSGSGSATGTGTGAAESSRGALVFEPSMCFVAMWRITPSSIFSTRTISSSVAASDSNTTRW